MAKSTAYKINPEKLKSTLLSIKARLESKTLQKMTEVSNMYSTGLKKALGMGHDTFITKFSDPSKFTVEDILRLADITDVDKTVIWEFIIAEVEKNREKHDIRAMLPSIEEKNEDLSNTNKAK